jgi:hypothetical protein
LKTQIHLEGILPEYPGEMSWRNYSTVENWRIDSVILMRKGSGG